ncbi:GGDEF domain-containing protein [Aeoliella sp. ICT_H6.2]|uniref:diguanylate cyclase n=1 Tax=Aeoliella straminimaris TaxID=2954799 RepID=A0A9X2JHZ1_9BACT|nr:GGDEF domain-containing protein [Aeoliella straminimaris]MCO6043409.1 GGDEF domain-containing protein [Aeoliella straminimaris]
MELFDWFSGVLVGIPVTMSLAAVALLGYVFGRRTRVVEPSNLAAVGPRELHRAARVARQMEDTIDELRQQLAEHRNFVDRFKHKVDEASMYDPRSALNLLSNESEEIILPTLKLASRLSHAYDELRQQSQVLSNFTEGRTDPVTGLGNTPAFEEQLQLALGDRTRGGPPASIALVSVEPPAELTPGSDEHREFIKRVATEVERCVRGHDYIARLGGAEFAVLMPKTPLSGARVFGTRLRRQLIANRQLEAGCGIAEALPADTAQGWLSRADSALYSARAVGGAAQYLHTGEGLQVDNEPVERVALVEAEMVEV